MTDAGAPNSHGEHRPGNDRGRSRETTPAEAGSPRTNNLSGESPSCINAAGGGTRVSQPNSDRLARVAMTGWVLYIISWVTPSLDGKQFGAMAFVDSVRVAWHLLGTGNLLAGLCVMLGWLANFSILPRRLPDWLRVVAIVAPWLAFAVVLAKLPARATYFLYFYPWALGIALIQAARCSSMKAAS